MFITPPPNIYDVLPTITFSTNVICITYPAAQQGTRFASGIFNGLAFTFGQTGAALQGVKVTSNINGLNTAGNHGSQFNDHQILLNVQKSDITVNATGRDYPRPQLWPALAGL